MVRAVSRISYRVTLSLLFFASFQHVERIYVARNGAVMRRESGRKANFFAPALYVC
jgi:hypothetical protein